MIFWILGKEMMIKLNQLSTLLVILNHMYRAKGSKYKQAILEDRVLHMEVRK